MSMLSFWLNKYKRTAQGLDETRNGLGFRVLGFRV